jgi:hypothetical protein
MHMYTLEPLSPDDDEVVDDEDFDEDAQRDEDDADEDADAEEDDEDDEEEEETWQVVPLSSGLTS